MTSWKIHENLKMYFLLKMVIFCFQGFFTSRCWSSATGRFWWKIQLGRLRSNLGGWGTSFCQISTSWLCQRSIAIFWKRKKCRNVGRITRSHEITDPILHYIHCILWCFMCSWLNVIPRFGVFWVVTQMPCFNWFLSSLVESVQWDETSFRSGSCSLLSACNTYNCAGLRGEFSSDKNFMGKETKDNKTHKTRWEWCSSTRCDKILIFWTSRPSFTRIASKCFKKQEDRYTGEVLKTSQ